MTRGAADQGAQPREDFFNAVRLGDVIVGAGIETRDFFRPAVPRGQDENRHVEPRIAPAFEHADAIHIGQSEIEDDGIIGLALAEIMAFVAIIGEIDRIVGLGQGGTQLTAEIAVVFHYQDTHGFPILYPLDAATDFGAWYGSRGASMISATPAAIGFDKTLVGINVQ